MNQLSALGDVIAAFDGEAIEYWLFGGWAVDVHAGRVTREHDDVDLAIWMSDLPRIDAVLANAGWTDLRDPDADGGKAFARDGVRLELTFMCHDDDGEIYTPFRSGARGRWSPDALGDDVRALDGVRVRVVSLSSLTRMKSRAREDAQDAAKDRADYELLRASQLRPGRAPRSSSR